MNRSLAAGIAFVAGIAVAAPLAAYGEAASPTESAPAHQTAAPAPPQSPPAPLRPEGWEGRGWGMGQRGPMGHWGPMDHWGPMSRFGRRHAMMRHRSPAERCEERLARRAGMIAYTVTRLDLTAQQRPLWNKLDAVIEAGRQKQQTLCNALKTVQRGTQTILDRVDRREQFLSARLQTIREARPLLQQFYQALSPQQKAIIDHPFRRW